MKLARLWLLWLRAWHYHQAEHHKLISEWHEMRRGVILERLAKQDEGELQMWDRQ